MDLTEKLVELLTNSPQLDVLDWTTGWEEAANYLIAHGVTVHEQKSPCSLCGYGGKHLDSPPCTQCPAHPKEQPNVNQRNSNASNVQKWISVDDRLPEFCVSVLARCFYHGKWRTLVCHTSKENAGEWYTDEVCQWVKVTHWMPLPEPSKGE